MPQASQHSCHLQIQTPLLPPSPAPPMGLIYFIRATSYCLLLSLTFRCFLDWSGLRVQWKQKYSSNFQHTVKRETRKSTKWSPSLVWSKARINVNIGARFPRWSFCNKTLLYQKPQKLISNPMVVVTVKSCPDGNTYRNLKIGKNNFKLKACPWSQLPFRLKNRSLTTPQGLYELKNHGAMGMRNCWEENDSRQTGHMLVMARFNHRTVSPSPSYT
jgi:hypothetical protein